MLSRLFAIVFFFLMWLVPYSLGATESYRVNNLVVDNSDKIILIQGKGNYKTAKPVEYISNPSTNRTNIISDVTPMTLNAPYRYVVDIPNAILDGASRDYKIENSKTINNIRLSQFSLKPDIIRAVIEVNSYNDLAKFKIYSNGTNIIIKYDTNIVANSIQYKFYTPTGDMDKASVSQNTSAVVINNATGEEKNIIPSMSSKYHLSTIDKNSNGLILKGIGAISLQRVVYNSDNTKATLTLDNATVSSQLDGKIFNVPNTDTNLEVVKLSPKKIQLNLTGENLKDYRFVVSQDAQSIFISHRTNILNTTFSISDALITSYSTSTTSSGYRLFNFKFSAPVTYDVFELNDNFYLDIDNLVDFNKAEFDKAFKDVDIKAQKIASDKTRYTINTKNLKFSYANIESNAKSVQLCFKTIATVATNEPPIVISQGDKEGNENINVTYIPKGEDSKLLKKFKKKDDMEISAVKKVVLDPGHGGNDCGAIALDNKFYEKTINLEIAQMIKERLTKKGVHVYMTRGKDETLTLEERVNFANITNPDIYVSIHANSTLQSDRYGLETHYYKDDSIDLANTIHKHFASEKNLKKWETKDRGVIKSRFYVINHTEVPSVLMEVGFISNKDERDKLEKKERKEQIADSIAKGILEYLKVK